MTQIFQTIGIPDLVAFLFAIIIPIIFIFNLWLFFPSLFTINPEKKLRFAFSLPITIGIAIGCFYTSKLYFDLRADGYSSSYQNLLLVLDYATGLALIYIIEFVPFLYILIFAVEKFSDVSNKLYQTAGEAYKIWQGFFMIIIFAPILLIARLLVRTTWIPYFLFGESIKFWEPANISAIFSANYPIRLSTLINRITSSLGIQSNISGTVVFISTTLGVIVSIIKIIEYRDSHKKKSGEKDDVNKDGDLLPEPATFDENSFPDSALYAKYRDSYLQPSVVDDFDDNDKIDDNDEYEGVPQLTDSEFKLLFDEQKNDKDKAT